MTNSTINVAFLFLDHMHHVYHGAPTAFELSKDERFNVTLFTALSCNLDIFHEISRYYPDHRATFKKIDTTFWSGVGLKISKRVHPTVRNVLKKNLKILLNYDALITPDDCLHYIMNRDKKNHLKYITTLHGPGDNQQNPRYKKFDFILVSGKARWDLLTKQNVLTPDRGKIIGYPKFDVTIHQKNNKRIFNNNNLTVIYNPHADPQKSSYEIWGHNVLEFFYQNTDYNLIFAPHIMIFSKKRSDIPEKYFTAPNIHIDYKTKALADMTYTKEADIYIGDLSSQIYEFLYNPRPCIFLNAHQVDWKGIERFNRWFLGDVVENFSDFPMVLSNASKKHIHYKENQEKCFKETFSITQTPSSKRAATAIADFLTKNSPESNHVTFPNKHSEHEVQMTDRVLVLIRSEFSPFGGVETHALNFMHRLLDNNFKIYLLTWSNQQWPIKHPNLTIIELGYNRGNRLYLAWKFNAAVRKYLTRNQFNCILSMDQVDFCTHIHAGGGCHKLFLQIKKNNSSAVKRFFQQFSFFHRYIVNMEKKAFTHDRLKKIRCCSEMVQKDISNCYNVPPEKFVVIHNSINWKAIGKTFEQRHSLREKLLQKHAFHTDWNILLFLGSGFERKGLDIAIKGLKYMHKSFHLLVVGKGSANSFKYLAHSLGVYNRVHLIGPQKDGWKYSAICKGVVLPSRYEPFGIAAAEAQAMGLPALVSDQTGYSEIIQDGKNGVIINSPMFDHNIQTSFGKFEALIQRPVMTPEEMRNKVEILDDERIVQQLIHEFLCF